MLDIRNAHLSHGAIQAVRDVSIRIGRGEIVTIIGANGAGKSTLMRGITGLEPLVSGRVMFDGQDITTLAANQRTRKGIALSPEGRGVFADQSVLDNLLLGAYVVRDEAVIRAGLQRAYVLFPILRTRSDQTAGTLSGGEQQMLAIARALMSCPRLLLLDEPSLGLAPQIVAEIFCVIQRLGDEGLTVLLVEQMANQALAVSHRAYVLETGAVVLEGRGADLLRNPRVKAAYLGGH